MDATFWALAALVIFFGVIVWLKVPATINKSLDTRADNIRKELDEARRLREEAQELLAEYQRKRQEAEAEAESIVTAAKHEAELLAEDAARKTTEYVERRTAIAEQKIAQAEAEALEEVKASAVDLAIAASERLLGEKLTGNTADDLIKKSIGEVKQRLN